MATRRPAAARGATLIEFALLCGVLLALMLGGLEYVRLLFAWNLAPAVTQRVARGAAMADFTDAAALQAIKQAALPRNSDGSTLLIPNLDSASVVIDYLWQDSAGALQPLPVLPGCPEANRANCTREPYGSSCISFVRVRICGAGADCPGLPYQALTRLLPLPATLPQSGTVVRSEALGYQPGMASCL